MPICVVCGGGSFSGGSDLSYFCNDCGAQSQEFSQEVSVFEDYGVGGRHQRKRIRVKSTQLSQSSSGIRSITFLEALQAVLQSQVEALIVRHKCPNELQELVFGLWLRLINSLAHSKYVASDSLTLLQVKGKKEEDMLDHYDQSVDKGDGEGEGGDGSWGRDSQESTLLLGGGGQSDGGKRVVRDEEYRTVHRLFFNQKIAFEVTAGLCYLALLLLRFPLPLFKFVHSLAMEEIPYSTAFSELPHFTDIWLLRPQAPPSCRRIYHVTWALAVLTLGNTFTLPPASFELYCDIIAKDLVLPPLVIRFLQGLYTACGSPPLVLLRRKRWGPTADAMGLVLGFLIISMKMVYGVGRVAHRIPNNYSDPAKFTEDEDYISWQKEAFTKRLHDRIMHPDVWTMSSVEAAGRDGCKAYLGMCEEILRGGLAAKLGKTRERAADLIKRLSERMEELRQEGLGSREKVDENNDEGDLVMSDTIRKRVSKRPSFYGERRSASYGGMAERELRADGDQYSQDEGTERNAGAAIHLEDLLSDSRVTARLKRYSEQYAILESSVQRDVPVPADLELLAQLLGDYSSIPPLWLLYQVAEVEENIFSVLFKTTSSDKSDKSSSDKSDKSSNTP